MRLALVVLADPHRIYAFGGSMGGMETLLLLAKHPHRALARFGLLPWKDLPRPVPIRPSQLA